MTVESILGRFFYVQERIEHQTAVGLGAGNLSRFILKYCSF